MATLHDSLDRGWKHAFEQVACRTRSRVGKIATLQWVHRGDFARRYGAGGTCGVGEVVGPIMDEGGLQVAWILSSEPAQLDEEMRRELTELLFEEWLDCQRAQAQIVWYWGNPPTTE